MKFINYLPNKWLLYILKFLGYKKQHYTVTSKGEEWLRNNPES